MRRRPVYADDHVLLEVLGQLAGVPLGRCYYMATAVVRTAVEEWVDRLRADPDLGPEVERVLRDPEYKRAKYDEARRANPNRRRDAEQYAIRRQLDEDERERHRLADEAGADARRAGIEAGKVREMPRGRKP